jgi:hypothetical protein
MTRRQFNVVSLAAVLALSFGGAAMAASVEPVLFNPWQSGDAAFECAQAGCGDFAYKFDEWAGVNTQATHEGNTITIANADMSAFDWFSEYPVCAAIVKGGPVANVFYYDGTYGDEALYAPVNPNSNQNYDISHVSFCFNEPDMCYQEETAWAYGPRYVTRGSWATYTPYISGGTVNIYAGRTMLAGTAAFSAPVEGYVTISINLINGFVFYYDLNNPVEDDNLKAQDYASGPSGNPAPGTFAWKATIPVGSTTGSIVVPLNNFYGIHLDVASPVECAAQPVN